MTLDDQDLGARFDLAGEFFFNSSFAQILFFKTEPAFSIQKISYPGLKFYEITEIFSL